MAAKKSSNPYTVRIKETFSYTYQLAELINAMTGEELAPSRERTAEYTEGTYVQFRTKAQAVDFCSRHGFNRCAYLGKWNSGRGTYD